MFVFKVRILQTSYQCSLFNKNGHGHEKMDWELNFIKWADGWWSSPVLDQVLPWLTYLGSHFAVILFIILSWIITKQRKVLRRLVLLYAIQSAVIYGLKFLIQRQRPFLFLDMASKLSKGPGEILDPSFPSAHAAFSFMMATSLDCLVPSIPNYFFHRRWIHRMDANLLRCSLSNRCDRRSPNGLWDNKNLSTMDSWIRYKSSLF